MKRSIFACLVLLTGCAGEMQGQIRGTGERVSISYEQGLESDSYTAVIGNETFRGKAITDNATSSYGTAFGNAYGPEGVTSATATVFGLTTSNRIVAVLLGDKGNSLNCQMRYADSELTSVGGVGLCHHSDGRVIDVVW